MSLSYTPPSLSPRFSLSSSRPPTPRDENETSIETTCQTFIETCRATGVTCVVFDLDLTLSSRHSQGALDSGSLPEYCASLTSTSRILLPLLLHSNLTVVIATFSDELYTSSNTLFPYYSREAYVSGRPLVQAILRPILTPPLLNSLTIICLNPDLYRTSTPTASRIMPVLPSRVKRMLTHEREVSREVSLSAREVSSIRRTSRTSDNWFTSLCCCLMPDDEEVVTSSSFVTPAALPASPMYQPPPLRTIPSNHSNNQTNNQSNNPNNNPINHHLQTYPSRPSLSIPVPTPSPSSRSMSHSIPPAINQSVSHSINQSNTIRDSEGLVVTVNDVSMILEGDNEMELGMYQMQSSPSKRNLQQSLNLSVNNQSGNITALSPSTSPVLSNPLSINARTNNNVNQFTQYSPRHHLSHRSLSGHLNTSKQQNIMHSPSQQNPSVSPLNIQPQHYPRAGSPPPSTRPLPLQVPSTGTFTSPSTPSSQSVNPSLSTSRPMKPATPKTVPNSKMSKHFFPTTPKLMLTSRHSPAPMSQPPPAAPPPAAHNHGTLTQPLPPFAQLVASTALAAPHSINQSSHYNLSHTPSASQSILNIDKPLDQSSKHAFFINKLHALGLNQFHSMWSTVSAYPPPSYKTTHLHCVRALHALAMHQILLIDDMEENVNAAVAGGCYAIHVSGQTGLRAGHLQPERIIPPFSRD